MFGHRISDTTPDHITNRYLIVRRDAAGTVQLCSDATTQQPCGVISDGDDRSLTAGVVGVDGRQQVLVGSAGLTAGFHWITADAASKAKSGDPATDNLLGFAHVKAALVENQLVDVFVSPRQIDADT